MMQLLYFNWNALRTVRAQVADRPRYNSADPPEPTPPLVKFQIYTADCPLTLSGLSATHLRQSTRDNDVSGRISNPNGGPSGPPWRTVRSSLCPTTRDDNVSGQNPKLYGGLSAVQKRTIRSSTLWNPPETTSSLDKVRTLQRTVRSPIADCPLSNSGPFAVQSYENTRDNILSGQLLT